LVSKRKFLQTKKVIVVVFATEASSISIIAIPSPHNRTDQPATDFPDFGKLGMGRIHPRGGNQMRKIRMRNKSAKRVENYRRSMLPGTLRVY